MNREILFRAKKVDGGEWVEGYVVIDEIKPVSRWREFGYNSREAAAQDWNNLQPAHYCCNAAKSNKTLNEMQRSQQKPKMNVTDGEW